MKKTQIYGILDNTGDCPFYVSFFKDKKDASKELDRQLKSAMMEFGWVLNRDGDKFNKFSFKTTEFNLSKYSTKSTTFPKIQEIKTNLLFNCINSLDNKKKFSHRYLECNERTITTIKQEFLKRIYMPIYIPLLVLICSFLILISKNDFNYSKKRLSIFLYATIILIFSEISLRYATKMSYYIILLIPIFLFFLNYIIMMKRIKLIKNNK